MKKIIGLVVILTIVFSLCACGSIDQLDNFKVNAKSTIETYAASKGQDNYTAENWSAVEELIMDAENKIEDAEIEEEVNILFHGSSLR